ncbi:MAG: ABC transporter ATP-binding protein [bacterium]
MQPIIEIKGVGKKYVISHNRGGYVALRDVLASMFKNPFRYMKLRAKAAIGMDTKEEFWALRNIDLHVQRGEIIGIIGSNGAGKSTLLKILTGITPPTEGEIIMRGRVASLLEVGTGFHPELTGRENIFLNGAILGMPRNEIAKKFDEIVAFSGVEKFLDTPVRYYSSGMYVRLAFSVAAHMEPDILLVDEVLAVGDADFQKKCLGKMGEVVRETGRTILFVSHNMAAIEKLCSKCVLIEGGKVKMVGSTKDVIDFYLHTRKELGEADLSARKDRKGSGKVRFTSCELRGGGLNEKGSLVLDIAYFNKTNETFKDTKISIDIKNTKGEDLTNITNNVLEQRLDFRPGEGEISVEVKNINFQSGEYLLSLFMASDSMHSEVFDKVLDATVINLDNNGFYRTKKLPPPQTKIMFDFQFTQKP